MSKVNVNELTDEQKVRLSQLKEKDTVTSLIIDGMYNKSEIDFEFVAAIEKRSFKKQDYYIAAEVLFNTGASVDWINIVLNVITARGEDEIISFIREVVYAYNNHIEAESIAQFIDACDTPVELHSFTDDIIHQKESNNRVREVIENIPELIGKIETDSFEAKQNYLDMKNELDKKINEVEALKSQIETLQTESKSEANPEKLAKIEKKAAFYEKNFKESQKELRNYKDRCVHLEARLEEYKTKLAEHEKIVTTSVNNNIADELKQYFAEKFDASIDSIAKTVSSSYGQVLSAVKDNKAESGTIDIFELKEIITQNENIMEKLQAISNQPVSAEVRNKEDASTPQPHSVPNVKPVEEENENTVQAEDYEISENDIMGDIPEEAPEIVYEEPTANIDEENTTEVTKIEPEKDVNQESSNISETDTATEEFIKKSKIEIDPAICKAPDLTANKILSSKVKDDKQEKKIGFFARMKFKMLSGTKQKQFILDLMLHKKLPMNTITDVKAMLNTGNVDNSFVFDLINDENLTDEVVRKALAFVS